MEILQGVLPLIILLAMFGGICALYFLPAVIADRKRHQHRHPILLLNLFLGWTLIGWVGALVWAEMDPQASGR